MPDPGEDLRATAEAIRHDAIQVEAMEREKQALDPSDPRVGEISRHVERVATSLKEKAVVERKLSEELGPAG